MGRAAKLAEDGGKTQKLWLSHHERTAEGPVMSAQHGFGLRKGTHAMPCPSGPCGMPLLLEKYQPVLTDLWGCGCNGMLEQPALPPERAHNFLLDT